MALSPNVISPNTNVIVTTSISTQDILQPTAQSPVVRNLTSLFKSTQVMFNSYVAVDSVNLFAIGVATFPNFSKAAVVYIRHAGTGDIVLAGIRPVGGTVQTTLLTPGGFLLYFIPVFSPVVLVGGASAGIDLVQVSTNISTAQQLVEVFIAQ